MRCKGEYQMSTNQTLESLLESLQSRLNVVNEGLFNPEDFDPEKLDDLAALVQFIEARSHLSLQENEAVIAELKTLRK